MATLLAITTNPQEWTTGNWPRTHFNGAAGNGIWRFSFTYSSATQAEWGAYLARPTGGVWHTSGATIDLYDSADNLLASVSGTHSAGQTGTIRVDNVASGALAVTGITGGGTGSFSGPVEIFTDGTLKAGGVTGISGYTIAGTFSNIDDTVTGTSGALASTISPVTSSAAGAVAVAGALAAQVGAVTASSAGRIAIAGAATPTVGAVTVTSAGSLAATGSGSLAATIDPVTVSAGGQVAIAGASSAAVSPVTSSAAGRVGIAGALASTIAPVTLSASNATGLALVDTAANRAIYGTPAGTRTITLATSAATSILIATGGRLADLSTAPTDSNGNTYTAHGAAEEFADWAGYGLRGWICLAATGGPALVVSQQFGQTAGFDEVTIVGWAIDGATYAVTPAIIERDNAATVQAAAIATSAPAISAQAWCGDAPTGATAVVSISSGSVLDVTTLVDDPNGYVPIGVAAETLTAPNASYAPTWSHTPTQGAILWSAALQAVEGRLGALASTVGAVTLASSGQLVSAGNLAATVGPIAIASASAVALTGASSPSIAPITLGASGTGTNHGAVAATIDSVTSSAAGRVTLSGSASPVVGEVAALAAGQLRVAGASAATVPPVTSAATGTLPISGALDATIGSVAMASQGVLDGGILGFAAIAVGDVTSAGSGSLALSGAVVSTVGPVASSGAGAVAIAGSVSATIQPVTVAAAGGGPRVELPITFTVAVGISAAADFTVEVTP